MNRPPPLSRRLAFAGVARALAGVVRALAGLVHALAGARRGVVAFLCLAGSLVHSAPEPYTPATASGFDEPWRWTELEALREKVVRQAEADHRGHVWFGTRGGVLEYDGYTMIPHLFETKPGETSEEVRSLKVARDGSVYVLAGTSVARFREGVWTRLFSLPADASRGTRIAEARDGALWFATRQGLFRAQGTEVRLVELEGDRFSGCLIDESNRLWVSREPAGVVHIHRLSPETGLPESEPRRIATRLPAGRSAKLEMHLGPTGRVWLASGGSELDGLRVMEGDVLRLVRPALTDLGAGDRPRLAECRDGTLFVAGRGVVSKFDGTRWSTYRGEGPGVPAGYPFLCVFNGDTLLMGARMEKTFVIDLSARRWETLPGLLFQGEDDTGNAWFLTAAHEVVQREAGSGRWTRTPRGEGVIDTPNSLIAGPGNTLWASGSHDGVAAVAWWRAGRWTRRVHPELGAAISHVSALRAADGTLYFGSGRPVGPERPGGLVRYHVVGDRIEARVLPPPHYPARVVGIAETADGTLFFGGNGLASKAPTLNATPSPPFAGDWVDHVAAAPDGSVWLAVSGEGAYRLAAGAWQRFSEQDGLAGNSAVTSLLGRHSAGYWLATGEGVSRYDGRSWTRVALSPELRFRRESGTLRESADGSLWMNFGTRAWFFNQSPSGAETEGAFRTVRHTPNRRPPKTRLLAFDATAQEGGNLLLKWEGDDFWSQTGPALLEFSWRVDDGAWSPFSLRREQILAGIAPGAHRIEVRARDQDWNIDATPASAAFEVVPFLWRRPWFIGSVLGTAALLVALVVLLVRARDRHRREMEEFKLQFFTNLSHELRNPLAVVLGPLESLLRAPADGATRARLEMAYRNARKLGRLVDQLLEFRSAQSGTAPYRPVRADLAVFLGEAVETLRPLWQEKNQRVELTLPRGVRPVCFDPGKIQHIVENLLSNAIKYTPPGGLIEVAARIAAPTSATPAALELTVTDNGIGIARADQPRVFQPFFRGPQPASAEKGFGIGLAFTAEIVRRWGGEIELISPVPETRAGTRFTVRLPLVGDVGAEVATLEEAGIALPVPPSPGDTLTAGPEDPAESDSADRKKRPQILLIEDHDDVRAYLRGEFAARYDVAEACDGQAGLVAATQGNPDVIILDLTMPEIDGLELCRRLKANPETSHIPIMILTARRADEFREKGLAAGADDYFTKPVDFRLLATRVENLRESRRVLRERFTQQIVIQPAEITVTPVDEAFLRRAIAIVDEHMRDEHFDVEAFARRIGMSRVTLFRKLKAVTGQAPTHFVRSLRLKRAAQLLRTSDLNVSEILEHTGILDLSYFSRVFRQEFGKTPTQYRQDAMRAN